jgi:hypothetical protein
MSVTVQSPRDKIREHSTALISNDVDKARRLWPLLMKLRMTYQVKSDGIHGSGAILVVLITIFNTLGPVKIIVLQSRN